MIYNPKIDRKSNKNGVSTAAFDPYYDRLRSLFITPEMRIPRVLNDPT